MAFEFHTGFIVKYDVHRMVIRRGWDVAERYIRHGTFLVDLLAILAIIPELVAATLEGISGSGYKALYLLRLLRMLRVVRMVQGASGSSLLSSPFSRAIFRRFNTATMYLFNILLILAVSVNLMGCMWWFLAELEGLENSWVPHAVLSTDLMTANEPAQYVASVYFAITVLTTVGFGDIVPFTVPEMILVSVYMMCSLFYFGYVVSIIGTLLSELSVRVRSASALRSKLEDVETWLAVSNSRITYTSSFKILIGNIGRFLCRLMPM